MRLESTPAPEILTTACRFCALPIDDEPVRLWDGKRYCRKCVETVSPTLYAAAVAAQPLEETLDRSAVRAVRYVWFIWRYWLIFLAMIAVPLAISTVMGRMQLDVMLIVLGVLGGGPLVLLTLSGSFGAWAKRRALPRTIAVSEGILRIADPKHTVETPLSECKWLYGAAACDDVTMYAGIPKAVMLLLPDQQVACGYTPESRERWLAFLALSGLPQSRQLGCMSLLLLGLGGLAGGITAGLGAGYVIALITNNPFWMFGLGLLGAIEGPVALLLISTCGTTEHPVSARKRLHPALLGLAFTLIGMKIGIVGGWAGVVTLGPANGVLGAIVGHLCHRRINAAERRQGEENRSLAARERVVA